MLSGARDFVEVDLDSDGALGVFATDFLPLDPPLIGVELVATAGLFSIDLLGPPRTISTRSRGRGDTFNVASTGSNGERRRGVSSPSTLGDLRRRGLGDGF